MGNFRKFINKVEGKEDKDDYISTTKRSGRRLTTWHDFVVGLARGHITLSDYVARLDEFDCEERQDMYRLRADLGITFGGEMGVYNSAGYFVGQTSQPIPEYRTGERQGRFQDALARDAVGDST